MTSATSSSNCASGSTDARCSSTVGVSTLTIAMNASTGKLIARVPGPAPYAALAPAGNEVVSTGVDSIGHVYDISTRKLVASFHPAYTSAVTCFALSPNGRYAAQCDAKSIDDLDSPGAVDIWSTATGRLVRST